MLRDYPKEVILKDGTCVTLRPLRSGDASLLFDMFKRFSEDDRWFLDHDVSNSRLIETWVNHTDPKRTTSIVAELEGRIIADGTLIRKAHGAKNHIGEIRISVDPSFRDNRLGTWLLLDLINLSMAKNLEMLLMRLIKGKDAAVISGVKGLDFHEEAVLKNYVKDQEGKTYDLVFMIKHLHHGWGDF